jgi:hypothetical protein
MLAHCARGWSYYGSFVGMTITSVFASPEVGSIWWHRMTTELGISPADRDRG